MTIEQIREVQPHDFDASLELWSEAYPTREAAMEAALAELSKGGLDMEAAKAAGPFAP